MSLYLSIHVQSICLYLFNVLIDEFVCLLWLAHCYLVMLTVLHGMQTAK